MGMDATDLTVFGVVLANFGLSLEKLKGDFDMCTE
jgi:hypothetical protein